MIMLTTDAIEPQKSEINLSGFLFLQSPQVEAGHLLLSTILDTNGIDIGILFGILNLRVIILLRPGPFVP
jgi:hypothetical protein